MLQRRWPVQGPRTQVGEAMSSIHVVPLGDLQEHDSEPTCWCNPTEDEGVWLHHSMDRREHTIEQGKVQ